MERVGLMATKLASVSLPVAEEKGAVSRDDDGNETSEKQTMSDTKTREDEPESLTHAELLELTSSTLNSLLAGDTVLSDLPSDVTVEEVSAQIALVQGQSMTVSIVQEDGKLLDVVVSQSGTVTDLKRAVQRHVTLKLGREGRSHARINWRYVWRSNWLALVDGTRLTPDNAKLRDVGVRNKTRVKYVKRLGKKHTPE